MKMKLDYNMYFDKVYGAWLGKSIAGTIGAPFEGRKEIFHYSYDPAALNEMLPNDDLDLQLIWLHVLENKGIYLDSGDLADAFYHLYPFVPGEYAYFKKNYSRGIYPPVSGAFNNRYYINGNGCPIRSEIWACICPGNPELAAEYASKDGILDHQGDSVYAEQFLAAVEAAAFFESDLTRLFEAGLRFLPEGTKVRRLVEAVLSWSSAETSWEKVRAWIIRDYGHPDCTNMYQNLGFAILAMIYGKGDFIETTMLALNCGFDTDCSCATAGSLLGIIHGAGFLIEKYYNFFDTSYVIEAKVERRSNKLKDLAEDTCRVGQTITGVLNHLVEFENAPSFVPVPTIKKEASLVISVDYQGIPVIGWNESKTLRITIDNKNSYDVSGKLFIQFPDGWSIDCNNVLIDIPAGSMVKTPITFTVPRNIGLLHEKNIIEVSFGNEKTSFGLNGAQVWRVYGPFWENYVSVPETKLGEWYYKYIKGESEEKTADITRQYHLNTKVDPLKDYAGDPGSDEESNMFIGKAAIDDYIIANVKEDLFSVSDLIGFQGPCIVYAERRIYCPEDREVKLLVGHTDGYKLWINGEKVSESDSIDWWTAENRHHKTFLKKGENNILLKCIRHSKSAEFSLIFTGGDKVFPKHLDDLGSYI